MNTAVLHGIPEDTSWTVDHLSELGVDAVVCEAVDLLTRRSGESYMSYVRRVFDARGAAGDRRSARGSGRRRVRWFAQPVAVITGTYQGLK